MQLSRAPTQNGQAPARRIIAGQYLAKSTSGYTKRDRARDAAEWLRGKVSIKPTLKMAAEVFGVSASLVIEAGRLLEQRERGKRHGNGGTTALSDDAVERIVIEVGPERFLRVIDKITSPEFPLVAAE